MLQFQKIVSNHWRHNIFKTLPCSPKIKAQLSRWVWLLQLCPGRPPPCVAINSTLYWLMVPAKLQPPLVCTVGFLKTNCPVCPWPLEVNLVGRLIVALKDTNTAIFNALKVTAFVTDDYIQSRTSQHARFSLTLKRYFLQQNGRLIHSYSTRSTHLPSRKRPQ